MLFFVWMFDGYEQKQAAFQQPVFVLREVMRFHHRLRYHSIDERSNRRSIPLLLKPRTTSNNFGIFPLS